jgi:hypothetical protein
MEAFQDGVVIKEAFVTFYSFVVITVVLDNLRLGVHTLYILRVVFLCIGATLFCLRLLINRCYQYWLPKKVIVGYSNLMKWYRDKQLMGRSSMTASSHNHSMADEDQLALDKKNSATSEVTLTLTLPLPCLLARRSRSYPNLSLTPSSNSNSNPDSRIW